MPRLCIRRMTGGALSLRSLVSLSRLISAALYARFGSPPPDPERPLNRDLPVPEGRIFEDFALLALLECEKGLADSSDIVLPQLAVLLTEVSSQRLIPFGRVDQLHLALSMSRLTVGQYPHIRRNASVVKHVERQGDDGLQPVVLDDPAADVALALTRVSCKQRAAIVDVGDAAAQRRILLHLGELIGEEHHLAIA